MSGSGTAIAVLHPGSMGAAVGGQLARRGLRVRWLPEGRSAATVRRAEAAGLEAAASLPDLLARADVVISLCPPAAAEEVARQVAAGGGFAGSGKVFVEANAVTPERVRRIAGLLPGTAVVDASVIGSPPVGGKQPRLYVSGPSGAVGRLAGLFSGTEVQVRTLGGEVGKASALKLAYSGYQKVSRVLAAVAYGAADAHGVADELLDVAGLRPGSYLTETGYIPKTAARAWRWGPELEESAALLAEAGMPDEVVRAAAAVLARWNGSRDAGLTVPEALARLRAEDG